MADGRWVSWDRWDATQQDTDRRIGDLERQAHELSGAEQEHEALAARLTNLEQAAKSEHASDQSRRDRIWVLALTLVSGVIFPILVTAVITFLHLKSLH